MKPFFILIALLLLFCDAQGELDLFSLLETDKDAKDGNNSNLIRNSTTISGINSSNAAKFTDESIIILEPEYRRGAIDSILDETKNANTSEILTVTEKNNEDHDNNREDDSITLEEEDDPLSKNLLRALAACYGSYLFRYILPDGKTTRSTFYKWNDMVKASRALLSNNLEYKLWNGGTDHVYGMVNIAAFLAQAMQEGIWHNTCDELNEVHHTLARKAGIAKYPAAAACGQYNELYEEQTCTQEEDRQSIKTGKKPMACEVDSSMQQRGTSHALWYGAPPPFFCAPLEVLPKAPRWENAKKDCPHKGSWGYRKPINSTDSAYYKYVKDGGYCRDYDGIQSGSWLYYGRGCREDGCLGPTRKTNVQGCCWWGRGVLLTGGVCHFGKLNYYLGKRAKDEGRTALYPDYDFCREPSNICNESGDPQLKWVTGLFHYITTVQEYHKDEWNYKEELIKWVNQRNIDDTSFIYTVSRIFKSGTHRGKAYGAVERAENFRAVLEIMKPVMEAMNPPNGSKAPDEDLATE